MQICRREHVLSRPRTGLVITANIKRLDGMVKKLCYCCHVELYLEPDVATLAAKWEYKTSCIFCHVRT